MCWPFSCERPWRLHLPPCPCTRSGLVCKEGGPGPGCNWPVHGLSLPAPQGWVGSAFQTQPREGLRHPSLLPSLPCFRTLLLAPNPLPQGLQGWQELSLQAGV